MRLVIFLLSFFSIPGAFCQNLTAALASNSQLSGFLGLLSLAQLPANFANVTILAPSNRAISNIPNATLALLASNATLLNQVLSYHILLGNYDNFPGTTFIPTFLQQSVTGGQRVNAVPGTTTTTFYSGLLQNSSTVNQTIPFDGGYIHIINSLLTPPVNVTSSAVALNLTSAVGAITAANLASTIDTTSNLTVFLPNNAAFRRIGSALGNVSANDLSLIMRYHTFPGLLYSTRITNAPNGVSYPTLAGNNLTLTIINGTVYVNNARIVVANVLTSNGVVHVIDDVLNPSSSAGFVNATSASGDVLTSGVPTPTSSINTAAASGTSRAAASSASAISNPGGSNGGGGSGDLSTGAKAAIGVVVPIVVIAAVVAAVLLTRRHMLKKNKATSGDSHAAAPGSSEKAELAGTVGRTITGESGQAYAKPELSNSRSVRRSEIEGGPVPVRHEVEGEGVSASIKNFSDLTYYERYELEGHNQYPQRN